MAARWATEADASAIAAWWNTREVQASMDAAGYEAAPWTRELWADQLRRPYLRVALGFVGATLRALLYGGQGKPGRGAVALVVWAVDPRITVAAQRTQLLDCLRLFAHGFDPAWVLTVPVVPAAAVRLRDALNTRMDSRDEATTATREPTGRTYTLPLATLRSRV